MTNAKTLQRKRPTTQITAAGLAGCRQQLAVLHERRINVLRELTLMGASQASEPADLSSWLATLGPLDAEIGRLESIVYRSIVVTNAPSDRVQLGSGVRLRTPQGERDVHIVSSGEIDGTPGNISDLSPLGQQLLGKRLGDTAVLERRDGSVLSYEVVEITS